MDKLQIVTQFLAMLEDHPQAALVLIALAAIIKQWPPKG
ncbi:hypothetical protein SRABI118_04072 [Massilia sp. Bi118]|nr:hypothetical protein SRABI118_04072 [Massilia sp. Bi118]